MDVKPPVGSGDGLLQWARCDDAHPSSAAAAVGAAAGASSELQKASHVQSSPSGGPLGVGEQAVAPVAALPLPAENGASVAEAGAASLGVAGELCSGAEVAWVTADGTSTQPTVPRWPAGSLSPLRLDSDTAAADGGGGSKRCESPGTATPIVAPAQGAAAATDENGEAVEGERQGSIASEGSGSSSSSSGQLGSPHDDYMPNEGFDTDGSETAGVYDVSDGAANANLAGDGGGGANHVCKRLRRGRVRSRQSSGSSSTSSGGDGVGNEGGEGSDSSSNSSSSSSSSNSGSSHGPDAGVNRDDELSSDSDSDSDEDAPATAAPARGGSAATAAAASSSAEAAIAQRPLPACPLVRELWRREEGVRRGCLPSVFTQHLVGSVNFVQRLQLYGKLNYHVGCVNTATFNSTGTLLTSGSDDLNVAVWDWARKRALLHFESGHHNNVFQSKFMMHSSDTQIVTSARDGQVRLAELSTTGSCRSTRQLAQHRGAAHKIAIEPDAGHTLLSAGEDGVTFQIDLREEKPTRLLCTKVDNQKVPLYSIDKNPCNPNEFIVSGHDQFIRTYDKRKITNSDEESGPVKKFCPHALADATRHDRANVTCCVYNYDGSEVLGTYNDDDIYLFNNGHSDGAEYVHVYKGHRNSATVKGVNFYGPKSEFVVSGSDCGNIFLWDKESEQVVQFMPGDDGGVVNVLEPHPTCAVLATSGLDHDVKLWMPTAAEPTNLEGLAKATKKNDKERRKERLRQPQIIDGHMLWMIMQHIQRSSRRAGGGTENPAGDGVEADNPSGSDSSDDEAEMPFRTSSCTTS